MSGPHKFDDNSYPSKRTKKEKVKIESATEILNGVEFITI